jgi:cytochrome c-type biogenesis protein CcmH/NrfG
MGDRIKSYKLSPQLQAEIGYAHKAVPTKASIKIEWSRIPVKSILVSILAVMVILGGYAGIKKVYQKVAYNRQQETVKAQQELEQRLAAARQEVVDKNLSSQEYLILSQNYLQEGDGDRAQIAAELSTQKDPAWRDAFVNLGRVYMSVNRFDQAKEAFKSAIAIDPIYGNSHYLLYLACQESRDNESAKQELARAKKFGFDLEIGG